MKISMWILAEWLGKYKPRLDIKGGEASISGVRIIEGGLSEPRPEHVYIGHASEAFFCPNNSGAVMLVHGSDFIFVENTSAEAMINEVLTAIDFYNNWESRLWEASILEGALQKMIELSDNVFNHPSRIMDMDARVLTVSKRFGPDDVDERWKKTYETGIVQLSNVSTSVVTFEGEYLEEWEEAPRRYVTEDRGMCYIAAFIQVDNEKILAFLIQEFGGLLTEAHCQLATVFCDVLKSAMETGKAAISIRPRSSILLDLLSGRMPEEGYADRLNSERVSEPFSLIVIRSIYESTPRLRKSSMLSMIRGIAIPNISLSYGEDIICVASNSKLDAFIHSVMAVINQKVYMAGISLPFEGWGDIPTRYRQACFAIIIGQGIAGVYHCKDFAFPHLIKEASELSYSLELIHPALFALKRYDNVQGTDFYETLFHYLANERSPSETAKAMGIHRNTLMYRIHRIYEVIGGELNDPDERAFIYLSYKIQEQRLLLKSGEDPRASLGL